MPGGGLLPLSMALTPQMAAAVFPMFSATGAVSTPPLSAVATAAMTQQPCVTSAMGALQQTSSPVQQCVAAMHPSHQQNDSLERSSPSRSVSSASPPFSDQPSAASAAVPEDAEYLKELQSEKEALERLQQHASGGRGDEVAAPDGGGGGGCGGGSGTSTASSPPTAERTNHALKLLEQGERQKVRSMLLVNM